MSDTSIEPVEPIVEVTEAPDAYSAIEDAIVSAVNYIVDLKNKLAAALAAPQASQAEIDAAKQEASALKAQLDALLTAEATEDAAQTERLTKLAEALKASLA